MPGEIALDSNILVDLLGGNAAYEARARSYEIAYLPVPVLGELLYGALISTRPEENLLKISRIVSDTRLIPCDREVAEKFAEIKASLKKLGNPIPETDIWIGACCLKQNVSLATQDRHFDHIAALKKENW